MLRDDGTLDGITDVLIDHCSLYRLATGLKTAIGSSLEAPIITRLQDRVGHVEDPLQLEAGAYDPAGEGVDLLITSSEPADDWQGLLRPGGVLAFLGPARIRSPFHDVRSVRFIRSVDVQGDSGSLGISLYQKVSPGVDDGMTWFGVELLGALYNGVLNAGRFTFPKGKWSLLVGRSGIGKTTLLELIIGLRTARTASVIATPGRVFYLPQDAEPIAGVTVDTNIALFAESMETADEIVRHLHLESIRQRLVDRKLSGGERQRVVLAQALGSRPDAMLLDEPSAGLDSVRRAQVFYYLRDSRMRPATVLCVAHDFAPIMDHFDHLFEIMNGVLVMHR
jgi:ABC-type Mn2+/Zn2+ transport system ATPase subunit